MDVKIAPVFILQKQRELIIPNFNFSTSNGDDGEFYSSLFPSLNCLSGNILSFWVLIRDGFRHIRIREFIDLMDTQFPANISPCATALWGHFFRREFLKGFFVAEGISKTSDNNILTYINLEIDQPPCAEKSSIPNILKRSKIWKVSSINKHFHWLFKQIFKEISFEELPKLWQEATLDLRGLEVFSDRVLAFSPLAIDLNLKFIRNRIEITKIKIYTATSPCLHSFLIR